MSYGIIVILGNVIIIIAEVSNVFLLFLTQPRAVNKLLLEYNERKYDTNTRTD